MVFLCLSLLYIYIYIDESLNIHNIYILAMEASTILTIPV